MDAAEMVELQRKAAEAVALLETRVSEFERRLGGWDKRMRKLHTQNIRRLRDIDHSSRNNGQMLLDQGADLAQLRVKMAALYGNGSGKPGAVERMDAKLEAIKDKVSGNAMRIAFACGIGSALVTGGGMLISFLSMVKR